MSVKPHDLQNFAAEVTQKLSSENLIRMPFRNDDETDAAYRYPINSIPIDEDTTQGVAEDGGISAVRRFFALLVTFDLCFILLLWIIVTVASGLTLSEAFSDDVLHYDIKKSMFDVFMLSGVRFTCLILAYLLLRWNHWCVVALTTLLSCIFLITKVFYFSAYTRTVHIDTRAYTFAIFLMVVSFLIAWIEAWFYDCRVVPLEKKAFHLVSGRLRPTERSSLLHRYLQSNHVPPSETVGTFYSPFSSPPDSEDEDYNSKEGDRYSISSRRLTRKEIEFKRKGKETLEAAWQLLNSDGWVFEKSSKTGDTVLSKRHKEVGKVFLLSGEVELNGEQLLEELFYRMEDCPKWNPTVLYCKVIQKIDSHTDICYNVAAEGAGGLVAARDFVNLRHWELREGIFISCGTAVTHPDMPPQKKYTRGENGPGAYIIRTIPEDPHRCHFQWLLNTNLKGWVPQYLVDQALSGVMLEYIGYIRKYAEKLHREQQQP